jgi:tetratricopeptide (TPR) repeat protein
MADFLLLGSSYFKESLTELGYTTFWAGDDPECDLRLPAEKIDLPLILTRMPGAPQAIILTDDLGSRVLPSGLEKTSIPKIWYAVDSPLNFFWQKEYAPLFDLVLVDQKDCAARLARATSGPVHWLPVGIQTRHYEQPARKKEYDLAFVGTLSKEVRPKRSLIIEALSRRYSLSTAGGKKQGWVSPQQAARLYARARMVLNENLFDGVTTRMLEGMASGSLLLTEAAANGLGDLFESGHDLAAYTPFNLFQLADFYLKNHEERERVAARGRDKIWALHDIRHRTIQLLDLAALARFETDLTSRGAFFRQQGKTFFLAFIRWPVKKNRLWLVRAENMLKRAREAAEADRDSLLYLGLIQRLKGEHEKGIPFLEEASTSGSLRAKIALGFSALEQGHSKKAADHFSNALQQIHFEDEPGLDSFQLFPPDLPLSAGQHYSLGRALEKRGHGFTPGFTRSSLPVPFYNAFEHYLLALKIEPNHLLSLKQAAKLLAGFGAYTEAYFFMARAAEIAPQSSEFSERAEQLAHLGYVSIR